MVDNRRGLFDRLFAWFKRAPQEEKQNSVTSWVPLWQDKTPVWSSKNFKAFAVEGYKKVVWVYACVREIATSVSSIPWSLYRKQQEQDGKVKLVEVEQHPLLDLLKRPNRWMSGQEFFEGCVTYLNLAGNAYWELAGLDKHKCPSEMYLLRPDRVKVVASRQHFIDHYIYTVNNEKFTLDVDEVIHLKYLDPLDDYYGMSPIEAAARTIDTENEAVDWNKVFFQNAARPDGALVTEQQLTDEQFERLAKQIEQDWQGTRNAHKPLLLEAGLKWMQLGLAQKDMDFSALRRMTREEICAVFGVPPVLVGILDRATYSNYEEARKSFYEETVIPMLDRLKAKLNAELVPRYGDDLVLNYDLSGVSALQESQDALFKRLSGAVKQGLLTVNEARKALGYDAVAWGDIWWAPANLHPVASATPLTVENKSAKTVSWQEPLEQLEELEQLELEGPEYPENPPYPVVEDTQLDKLCAIDIIQPDARKAYWRAFDRRRWGFVGHVAREVRKIFDEDCQDTLKAIQNIRFAGDIAWTLEKLQRALHRRWLTALPAIYVAVIEGFASDAMHGFEQFTKAVHRPHEHKAQTFDVWNDHVQNWIANIAGTRVRLICNTTLRRLRAELEAGMFKGESIDEIANRVQNLYHHFSEWRSTLIARTEIISASNAGSFYAAQQSRIPLRKQWLATQDGRVRDTHSAADGQVRAMHEPFVVGGALMMFPGDPSFGAPAREVIQCRCTVVYVSNGRP